MTQPHARSRCNQRSRELILLREIQDDIHFYNRHFTSSYSDSRADIFRHDVDCLLIIQAGMMTSHPPTSGN